MPIHQLYFTHCTYGTSLLADSSPSLRDQVLGYSVRASSLHGPALRRVAGQIEPYLYYQLPPSIPREQYRTMGPDDAPRRLLFVSLADLQFVAQISFRSTDTGGRLGAYFAHVLFSLKEDHQDCENHWNATDCIRLWQSPHWVDRDSEAASLELEPVKSLAQWQTSSPVLSDSLLAQFLGSRAPQRKILEQVLPANWLDRPTDQRQALLHEAMGKFQICREAARPLSLLAEAPFTALLTYGILRLASHDQPESDISFSTYELRSPSFDIVGLPPEVEESVSPEHCLDTRQWEPAGESGRWPFPANGGIARWQSFLSWLEEQAGSTAAAFDAAPVVSRAQQARLRQPGDVPGESAAGQAPERQVQKLAEALKRQDSQLVRDLFDGALVSRLPGPDQRGMQEWARRELTKPEQVGLKLPPAYLALVPVRGTSTDFWIRWTWPEPRFSDECLLGLTEQSLPGPVPPDPVFLRFLHPVTRTAYERTGGRFRLRIPAKLQECEVFVWATVNVGDVQMHSGPLSLGYLQPPPEGRPPEEMPSSGIDFTASAKGFRIPKWLAGPMSLLAGTGKRFKRERSDDPGRNIGAAAESPSASSARICPACGAATIRRHQQRKQWVCDACRHRWPGENCRAFISYRRDGGSETARLIRTVLESRRIECFLDVDDLGSHYFDDRLLGEIENAANFIVILSPGALERSRYESDWLRREIEHAIQVDRNIVPILKDGFTFPPIETLPEGMRMFPRYNCVEYSHSFFNAMSDKLVSFLEDQG